MKQFKVSIILPCLNEEKNVTLMVQKLKPVLEKYADYEILFIDDGSKDGTLAEIKGLAANNSHLKYISFSRSFMHQNALRAGLDYASGDCVICMDADLQQPPELLPNMIKLWEDGYEIVYTIRNVYTKESLFKRATSKFFYWLINAISNIGIKSGAADFRLMDKKVVIALREYREKYIFYRGVVATMGFKQIGVHYDYLPRIHGKSQYPLKKMLNLAWDGITGFSLVPVRIATLLGGLILTLASLYGIVCLVNQLVTGFPAAGWSIIMFAVLLIGGVQLVMIGILGEYLGKVLFEIKKRPNYIISEKNF